MIKLIASDIDGTLLQHGETTLSPTLFKVIENLTKQGYLFIAASGRQYANLRRLFEPIKDSIGYICENGALVVYQNKILSKSTLPKQQAHRIIQAILDTKGCEVLVSGEHTSYLQTKNQDFIDHMKYFVKNDVTVVNDIFAVSEDFLKISVYAPSGTHSFDAHFKALLGKETQVVTSGNIWLDMMPTGTNKGISLTTLCNHLKISTNQVIAFGDNDNDLEMLTVAGYPIAVENAKPALLQISKETVSSVEDRLRKLL